MTHYSAPARRIAAVVALGLLSLTGCGDAVAPEVALDRARQQWRNTAPDAYRLTIQRTCFCGLVQGPVEVIVRDRVVQSRRDLATGLPLDARIADAYPTVDGLFELIDDAITRGADQVELTFDPMRGYPRRISLDYRTDVADDELIVTVETFGQL